MTEKLQQLYDEVGGFGVLRAMGHQWQREALWVRAMTMLANEVVPRLPSAD